MSTTANIDSITISSTIGTDNSKIARPNLPVVKSMSVPLIASIISFLSLFVF